MRSGLNVCLPSLTKALANPPGHTLECHLSHNHLVHLDRSKNKSTMEGQAFKPTLILKKIKSLTTEFFFSLPYQMKRTRYTNTLIGWRPPPLDFFKLQMVRLKETEAKPVPGGLSEILEGIGLGASEEALVNNMWDNWAWCTYEMLFKSWT